MHIFNIANSIGKLKMSSWILFSKLIDPSKAQIFHLLFFVVEIGGCKQVSKDHGGDKHLLVFVHHDRDTLAVVENLKSFILKEPSSEFWRCYIIKSTSYSLLGLKNCLATMAIKIPQLSFWTLNEIWESSTFKERYEG